MRVVPHDVPVLTGAGLRLVGIDHEIMRPAVRLLGHERPLQPGRESGAAAPAQAGILHLADDPVRAFRQERLGIVPGAARARSPQPPVVDAVQIFEDAILVREHQDCLLEFLTGGLGAPASCTFAGAPGLLAWASLKTGSRVPP